MDTLAYLNRIGLSGHSVPGPAALSAIHVAHLYSVPFENFDIGLGRPIRLDLERIYDKIVLRRRGGFCYELNGLLAWLLQELGYEVALISARTFAGDGSLKPEYDHLVLQVRCPGDEAPWLVDVGWGSGFETPLHLDLVSEQLSAGSWWRIDRDGEMHSLWQKNSDGKWTPAYCFTLEPRDYQEFAGMCAYHQSSPQSMFVRKRLCTLFVPAGRLTYSDGKLIVTRDGRRDERDVSPDETARILKDYFGVIL
jgi:N-hydroxyarylamine O-acetyltransferase